MLQAIREKATVKPGGLLELRHPELPSGTDVEIVIMVDDRAREAPSLASLIGQGRGCFADANEVEAFLRSERDAWDS